MNYKRIFIICIAFIILITGSFWIKDDSTGEGSLSSDSIETSGCPAGQARSITRFGITWYFQECEQYGTFANGDYWIIGPVTITRITPEDINTTDGWDQHGTMVNPKPHADNGSYATGGFQGQGFDSSTTDSAYDAARNVAPHKTGRVLLVPANSSVVSSASVNTKKSRPQIQEMEILTVLSAAPPQGSFRPGPADPDKSIRWNKSQLNYNILKSYAPVANTPALSTVEGYFAKSWFALYEGNQVQAMSPKSNMLNYGRDQAHQVSDALLSLHLNYTSGPGGQKEKLYIALVQYGIDIYGSLRGMEDINNKLDSVYKDGFFRGSGGLNNGRKAPMVLAGLALNDADIQEWSDAKKHFVFAEDKQTFYITKKEYVDTPRLDAGNGPGLAPGQGCSSWQRDAQKNKIKCLRFLDPYTVDMVGTPEWSVESPLEPNAAGSGWGITYYRWIGGVQTAHALGIRLIDGGVDTWNWPAFFDYEDRFWDTETDYGRVLWTTWSGKNGISSFEWNMQKAYGRGGTPPTTATLSVSKSGDGTVTGQIAGTSNSAGINCGTDCSATFTITNNTTITLTAIPVAPAIFTGWSGGGCSGTGSCVVAMNGSKTVTAIFTPPSTIVCKPWN